jgi:hypothetical protein
MVIRLHNQIPPKCVPAVRCRRRQLRPRQVALFLLFRVAEVACNRGHLESKKTRANRVHLLWFPTSPNPSRSPVAATPYEGEHASLRAGPDRPQAETGTRDGNEPPISPLCLMAVASNWSSIDNAKWTRDSSGIILILITVLPPDKQDRLRSGCPGWAAPRPHVTHDPFDSTYPLRLDDGRRPQRQRPASYGN